MYVSGVFLKNYMPPASPYFEFPKSNIKFSMSKSVLFHIIRKKSNTIQRKIASFSNE